MTLDPATLGVASVLLLALMGGLLLFAWLQNRTIAALGWWGLGFCVSAAGIIFLGLHDFKSRNPSNAVMVGNALSAAGTGIMYSGCRSFNGRSPHLAYGFAGVTLWLAAWPFISESFETRLVLMAVIMAGYQGFGGWELWRHAPHSLMSQRAVVVVLFAATLFCVMRGLFGPLSSGIWLEILARRWSSEMALLLMLYIPTIAVLLLSMAKEKLEFESRQAALLDPLTLLPNRRAFFIDAEKLAARHTSAPLSCLLFDLDGFKQINDTYGHAAGDQVLRVFARILTGTLPVCAYGRLGGEEFAAILEGDGEEAEKLAETIRSALANAQIDLVHAQIQVTVSAGYATACGASPQAMLSQADKALYAAKARGRNTIVSAESHKILPPSRRTRRNESLMA